LFVHQPPAWFRLHWKDFSVFSKVKAVVCLCHTQAQFFESVGVKQIVQIRHGVNLDFFFPKKLEASPVKKLLFVGQWLRDMKTLSEAFYIIEQQMPNIELHCVVPQRNRNNNEFLYRLAQSNKVFWYDNISQEQLRDLYQSSHCLMLPLIDATANNALNEALACGLPMVTTQIGGTPDYVFTPGGTLAKPHDALDLSNQCLVILNNLTEFQSKQQAIRIHAESNLNWHKQVETLLNFLLP
jgi:glycosyltransferase involved in cell wall biosynthesis